MKKLFNLLPLMIILVLTIIYQDKITNFIIERIIFSKAIYIEEPNQYSVNYNFKYVHSTDDFIADDKQELINILYTIFNNGSNSSQFYCHYNECLNDLDTITSSKNLVNINNYVHPYNNYRRVYVSSNSFGKVDIRIEKSYTSDNIEAINNEINNIISKIITSDMTTKEKIIAFHDYIIDTTYYDSNYLETNLNDIDNPSHKAIGPLFFGKALCGGYADVMAIFLNQLNIPNYRISSSNHIWNYVYLDNNWYHLDLTWDDPVTDNGENIKLTTFLLITTNQLEELATGYHSYDKNIYLEAK